MPKFLMLSTDTSQNWRLPDETPVDSLRARIEEAMTNSEVIRVPVVVPVTRTETAISEVLLNGKTLPYAAVVELP